MVYHATNPSSEDLPTACSVPLMPLRGAAKGPAPQAEGDLDRADVVQEALDAFRANVLFRSFDVESPADKLLIYVTLAISCCLQRFAAAGPSLSAAEAERLANAMAHEPFPCPGQAGFPLPGLFSAPQSKEEGEAIREYLAQLREEAGRRLVGRCFVDGRLCKHWAAFAGRRFLNLSLEA